MKSIFESLCYFGEISLEETKNILKKEPPKSFLFRRLKNGCITLATLEQSGKLLDVEVKNCNCKGTVKPINKFKNLAQFIEYCNYIFARSKWKTQNKFKTPVTRKNILPLEEMAKCCIETHFHNSIKGLNLPNENTENLKNNHNHFDASIDEKEAKYKLMLGGWNHLKFGERNMVISIFNLDIKTLKSFFKNPKFLKRNGYLYENI